MRHKTNLFGGNRKGGFFRLTARMRARMADARPKHAPNISAMEKISGEIKTNRPQICFSGTAMRACFCCGLAAAAHAFAAQKIKTDGKIAGTRIFLFNL